MFTVRPPDGCSLPSFFVFSFPKAGSTLLEGLMRDLCAAAGMALFNPSAELFARGIAETDPVFDPEPLYAPNGCCFGAFRSFPAYIRPHRLAGRKALMLVRDPGDMLTSRYYSLAVSHVPPGEGRLRQEFIERRTELQTMSIDDFVATDLQVFETLLDHFIIGLRRADLRLYRYEDVIYRKAQWLQDMAGFLDLPVPPPTLLAIAARHDLRPEDDRPERHVRQVRPGDHLRKLRPDTIAALNARLSQRWLLLGYPFVQPRADIALPSAILQQMANPYRHVGCEIRLIGPERAAQAEAAFLPRAPAAEIHPERGAGILGLWLEDPDGGAVTELEAGAPFTLAYIVRLLTDEAVVFGFRIADRNGRTVLGLNTEVMEATVPTVRPPQLVEVRWRLTTPGEGHHLLSCGCSRAENPLQMLGRHVNAYAATIRPSAGARADGPMR